MPGPAGGTLLPPTTPERAAARRVVDPEPAPHCLAWVRTLQALAPLASSMKMPEIAVGPRAAMLLQVAGARMTAAPLVGVKLPNSGGELPDPQAANKMKKIAGARLINGSLQSKFPGNVRTSKVSGADGHATS